MQPFFGFINERVTVKRFNSVRHFAIIVGHIRITTKCWSLVALLC